MRELLRAPLRLAIGSCEDAAGDGFLFEQKEAVRLKRGRI